MPDKRTLEESIRNEFGGHIARIWWHSERQMRITLKVKGREAIMAFNNPTVEKVRRRLRMELDPSSFQIGEVEEYLVTKDGAILVRREKGE